MSDNIFKELCNKVLSLFKQTEKEEENAKDVACNRLRVVLMQDRTNLTPELLQRMRRELVELLSKYVEMDKDALELNFDQEGDQMALMLSIPVIRAKDEAEIEEALNSEDETEEENEENDDENLEDDEEIEISEGDENCENKEENSNDENVQENETSEENKSEEEINNQDENSQNNEEHNNSENFENKEHHE